MPQGPDGLPNLEDLPSVEVLERLLVLADEASGLKSEREKFLQEAREKLEKAIESEHRASVLLGALRYTIVTPLSKLKKVVMPAEGTLTSDPPPEPAAAGATATTTTTTTTTASAISPRLAAMLALVGLASLAVAAGYSHPTESPPVTATLPAKAPSGASTAMIAGASAQLRGDYREALGHFQDAGTRGAVPECYCPPMIECYLNTQQFGLAGFMLAKLSNSNPRDESLVPYYRAAILNGAGHTAEARPYYAEAEQLGHPGAAEVLEFIGRE
jgi:tetratricopeptide (TPR) repeat protein